MSVIKAKRDPSPFDVLHNALEIRRMVTDGLLRNFGYKRREIKTPSNFDQWSRESQEAWMEKQRRTIEKQEAFDKWYIETMRNTIMRALQQMIANISMANTIYPMTMEELNERRMFQNRAIGSCHVLMQELQYVIETLPVDLEKYTRYGEAITSEIRLLKGWRKSDNKIRRKLSETES